MPFAANVPLFVYACIAMTVYFWHRDANNYTHNRFFSDNCVAWCRSLRVVLQHVSPWNEGYFLPMRLLLLPLRLLLRQSIFVNLLLRQSTFSLLDVFFLREATFKWVGLVFIYQGFLFIMCSLSAAFVVLVGKMTAAVVREALGGRNAMVLGAVRESRIIVQLSAHAVGRAAHAVGLAADGLQNNWRVARVGHGRRALDMR